MHDAWWMKDYLLLVVVVVVVAGAIELMVFSEHFQVELAVLDIQTLRMDRFGECKRVRCEYLMCRSTLNAVSLSYISL